MQQSETIPTPAQKAIAALPQQFVVLHVDAGVPFIKLAEALAGIGLQMHLDPADPHLNLFVVRPRA